MEFYFWRASLSSSSTYVSQSVEEAEERLPQARAGEVLREPPIPRVRLILFWVRYVHPGLSGL